MDLVIALTAVALLWLPGVVASRTLAWTARDPFARFAEEVAFGVAFWPLLFLLPVTWGRMGAWAVFLALVVAWLTSGPFRKPSFHGGGAVLVAFALVVATRLLHVRDVVWPLWVDSVHHTMIVRLLTEQGVVPASYEPFIAESVFYYHWGFHAIAAFLAWITGGEIPRLLLVLGQVLNALMFFALYCGARALWVSRRTALAAAVLAMLVSHFPAYYVSGGRYTHMCALLVLPPLAAAYWRLGRHPSRGRLVAVAVMAAGLLLIHVRVALVFAVLAALLTMRMRRIGRCAAAAALALLMAGPWLVRLAATPQVRTIVAPPAARWEAPRAVTDDLLWAPNNVPLFLLATGGMLALLPADAVTVAWRVAGIALWLALIVALQKRRRRSMRWLLVVAWVVAAAVVIRYGPGGFSTSAALIMLFLPASLLGAHVVALIAGRWTTAVALVLAIAGAASMRTMINPETMLVTAADRDALRWIADHVPRDATFGVGVQPWIAGTFVGIDGGYWIPVVTDRRSLLPPGLYPWVTPEERAERTTATLARWDELERHPSREALATFGVTHLYFGARNATPLREAVRAWPELERVWARGGVEVYRVARRNKVRAAWN